MFVYEQGSSVHSLFGSGITARLSMLGRSLELDNYDGDLTYNDGALGHSQYDMWVRFYTNNTGHFFKRLSRSAVVYGFTQRTPNAYHACISWYHGPHGQGGELPGKTVTDITNLRNTRLQSCLTR